MRWWVGWLPWSEDRGSQCMDAIQSRPPHWSVAVILWVTTQTACAWSVGALALADCASAHVRWALLLLLGSGQFARWRSDYT